MEKDFRILIIACGGEICTLQSNGENIETEKSVSLLAQGFDRSDSEFAGNIAFVTAKNSVISAEGLSGRRNALLKFLRGHAEQLTGFDGIVVLCSAESCAFTANLFSYVLGGLRVPVIFIASKLPPRAAGSHAAAAFRAALECCCIGIDPNVYALCITGSKRTLLHKAARITGFDAKKFDFISDCGADLSTMDEFDIDAIEYPPAKELPFKPLKEGWPLKDIETDCAKRLLALSAGYADIDGFMAEEYNGEAVTA